MNVQIIKPISINDILPLTLVDVHLAVPAFVARLAGTAVVVNQVQAGTSMETGKRLTVVSVLKVG